MGPSLQPTYANIMRELSRFLAGQKPGDKFFFGYAGHSSQKKNLDGTEKDGLDEFIIPSDASDFKNGDYSRVILDDVLKEKLVVPLLAGSQLVAVLDTCHSATLFDLEHDKCNRVGSWHSLVRRTVRRARETLHTLTDKAEPTLDSATPLRSSSKLSASSIKQNLKENIKFCSGYCCRPWTPAPICTPVLCISACKDSQLVWEADGESLTRTFVDVLTENPKPTLAHLMRVCNLKSRTTLRALRRAKHQGDEWNPQSCSAKYAG
ncbi:peptidase C14, caspase domain-containing protein [Mycena sp. CBHHK59/15]|nr:peptidase C14, caspase domain-containing protein [Mycena sp. CBHHK59/15]